LDDYLVKDLMVPLSEYATVKEEATLFEAVLALEKAQEEFDHTKYRHRAILVLDRENKVIGKVGQVDVLHALEPKAADLEEIKSLSQFGFSDGFIQQLRVKRQMGRGRLKDLCLDTAKIQVKEIMQAPTEGEIIGQDEPIESAIQQLLLGGHIGLLVTNGNNLIIGILRLTDVFAAVFHVMKECEYALEGGSS
jgi:CBS domain-containing protein